MKIRTGYITNSSSTNFLIVSKKELTEDYLFNKLGFKKGGALEKQGYELCDSIMYSIRRGLRYDDNITPDYETILKEFGQKAAEIFQKHDGYHAYWGCTGSDDEPITQFFTTDSFEIDERDFYINGRCCVW